MGTELARPDVLVLRPLTPAERRDASRYVLRHAHSRDDLHQLLDALGLNPTPQQAAPAKRASVPATTTTDCPINTRKEDS